jgi:hypothetical protein
MTSTVSGAAWESSGMWTNARARHQVAVGHERAALARHLGHAHDLGDAFAHREPPLARTERPERANDEVVPGQLRPHDHRDPERDEASAEDHRLAVSHAQRHDTERDGDDEHGDRPLHAERRQEQEAHHQRARYGADRVGEVQQTGAAPDGACGVLNDRIRQGKGEAHHQRGHGKLAKHGREVHPEAAMLGHETARLRGSEAVERRDDEERLRGDVEDHGPADAPRQKAARDRAEPDAGEDHGEDQREHPAIAPEQRAEVTEPDDLHPHRRESGKEDGEHGHRERRRDGGDLGRLGGLGGVHGPCRGEA